MSETKSVPTTELTSLTTTLFKLQNFKADAVISRVSSKYYKPKSITALHSLLRRYLFDGEMYLDKAPKTFYDAIKECISCHVQPLRPNKLEKARPFALHPRKEANVKVEKTTPLSDIQKEHKKYSTNLNINKINKVYKKEDLNTKYGILMNNKIVNMFDTKVELDAYVQALKDFDIANYELVQLSLTKI